MEAMHRKQHLTFLERIAQIISAVFHPLILPAIAFTVLVIEF